MKSLFETMKKVDIPSCIAVQRFPSYADHYLNVNTSRGLNVKVCFLLKGAVR